MNLNNKLCSCGSGKKYKKCCLNRRKPRSTSVTVDMGKPTALNGLRFDPITGIVKFLQDGKAVKPASSRIETGYERIKGQKVLNRIPLPNDQLVAVPDIALKGFDVLFAIDTNTNRIREKIVSVTCIVTGHPIKIQNYTAFKISAINAIAFWGIKEKQENIAWLTAIEKILMSPMYKNEIKFGLIVDSDLGNIPKYNERILPIYGIIYLPSNMQFIYASADSGKEFVSNKMMSSSDSIASTIFASLKEEKEYNGAVKVEKKPYSHIREWDIIT